MTPAPDRDDDLTPAERRLRDHLAVLAAEAPEPDASLPPRVVRSARWQRAVRAPLWVGGMLVGALGDATRVMIGAVGGGKNR